MNEDDQKMLEELHAAAVDVQANRLDEPVRRLGAALEAYAKRCLDHVMAEPTIETTPAKPQ